MKKILILFLLTYSLTSVLAQTCISHNECISAAWDSQSEMCLYQVLVSSPCNVGRAGYLPGVCLPNAMCSTGLIDCNDFIPPCYESLGFNEQLNQCAYIPVDPGTPCDTGNFCEVNGQCNNLQQCIGEDRDCSQAMPCSVSVCNETADGSEMLDGDGDEGSCVFDYYVACVPEPCESICTYPEQSWANDISAWGEDPSTSICDGSYEEWMTSPSLDNAWVKLFREWLAFKLNWDRGCCVYDNVIMMSDVAYSLLINGCHNLTMQEIAPFLETLHDYNTGVSGPGQCLDDYEVIQCQYGVQNPNLDSCDCFPGWVGEECTECNTNPPEGYTFLCVPLPLENLTGSDLDDEVTYILRTIENHLVPLYTSGNLPSFGQPIFDDDEDGGPIISVAPGTEGLACDCSYAIGKREINEQSDFNDLVGDSGICDVFQQTIDQLEYYLGEAEEHCCVRLLDLDDDDDDDDDDDEFEDLCRAWWRDHHDDGDDDDDDDDCDDDDWFVPFLILMIIDAVVILAFIFYFFIYNRRESYEVIEGEVAFHIGDPYGSASSPHQASYPASSSSSSSSSSPSSGYVRQSFVTCNACGHPRVENAKCENGQCSTTILRNRDKRRKSGH